MRIPGLSLLSLLLAFVAAGAAAHPVATVLGMPSDERCYIFWNDQEFPEYWVETNGKITGGVPQGTPLNHYIGGAGPGSGLQRSNDDDLKKDTKLSENDWLLRCATGDDLRFAPTLSGTAQIV